MSKHAPICPLVGEACLERGCEWWDVVPADPERHACRLDLNNRMLNDLGGYLHKLLNSSEQHRETNVQALRSRMLGQATPELQRLTGLGETDG